MKKLSLNQILQFVLILALVLNAVIHFTSPTYRYYQENFEKIKKGVSDFEQKVKIDFVPAILNLASNRVSSVVNSSSGDPDNYSSNRPLLLDGTNSNSRLMSLDFQWYQSGSSFGFELDGKFYHEGDLLFGSVVRSITPTLIVTDDYQFIKPLIGKFSLSAEVKSNPRPAPVPPDPEANKSHKVEMLPEPYFPQKEIRRGLGMEY